MLAKEKSDWSVFESQAMVKIDCLKWLRLAANDIMQFNVSKSHQFCALSSNSYFGEKLCIYEINHQSKTIKCRMMK